MFTCLFYFVSLFQERRDLVLSTHEPVARPRPTEGTSGGVGTSSESVGHQEPPLRGGRQGEHVVVFGGHLSDLVEVPEWEPQETPCLFVLSVSSSVSVSRSPPVENRRRQQ